MIRTLADHRKKKLQKEWSLFLDSLINTRVCPKKIHAVGVEMNLIVPLKNGKISYFVTKSRPWQRNKWQLLKRNVPIVTINHYKDCQGFSKNYIV